MRRLIGIRRVDEAPRAAIILCLTWCGLVWCGLAGLGPIQAAPARAADRVALVIGEGAYQATPSRPWAGEDANAIAAALREIGYEVTERYDLSGQALHDAVIAFGDESRQAKIAVAYFSGHAFRLGGVDYLAATNADPASTDLAALLPLDGLRAATLRAETLGVTLIESAGVDGADWAGAEATAGLSPLERELLVFTNGAATRPTPDRPSLFTQELSAAMIAEPGESAVALLAGVAEKTRAQGGGVGPELAVGRIEDGTPPLGAPAALAAAAEGTARPAADATKGGQDRPAPISPPTADAEAAPQAVAASETPRLEGAIVVSAANDGDYASLRVAVEEAPEGATLLIRPGLYQGGFMVSKNLTLLGEGERAKIVIEGRGADTLRWAAAIGRLQNLTLRQKKDAGVEAGAPWGAIDVLEGALTIENCDLSSESGAIIHVRDDARATIKGNQIHNGPRSGVFVYRRGQAQISANEVYGNKGSGVALGRERGVVAVSRNTLRDNEGSGVSVIGDGGGDIVKNEIFSNGESGVYAREGAHPRVVENVIRDNRGSGVEVQEKGRAVIKGNEIVRNHYANIEVGEGARVRIEDNVIRDGKQGGLFLHEETRGDILKNEIFGNKLAAIEIGGGSVAVVEDNVLRDGQASALFVHSQAMVTAIGNQITGNSGVGIRIEEGSAAIARRNEVKGNKGAGVYLNAGLGELSENLIVENKDAGLEATNGAMPVLRKNQIARNGYVGLWLYEGGGAMAIENDLTGNKVGATRVEASAGSFTDQDNQLE